MIGGARGDRRGVAVVMSGFPRVSETFAVGELCALADAGKLAGIFATKAGDLETIQPEARRLLGRLVVLADAPPDRQAAEVADRLADVGVAGIHGYFAHRPAEVAAGAARRLGVPFSFGAHALDTRKVDAETLRERASRAACVLACNDDAAGELRAAGAGVTLLPHGVDLQRFAPSAPPLGGRLRVLAVGRLVEKKGFATLLDAIAAVRAEAEVRIVGDGPGRADLQDRVDVLGLGDRVALVGRRTHDELPAEYAWSDVVVVPSVVDSRGDRDGLPNVVLEALASARAVVASDAGAIASAIEDGVTGLLVPPGDIRCLAAAIERVAADPALRERLGRAGRARAVASYDRDRQTERFVHALEAAYA